MKPDPVIRLACWVLLAVSATTACDYYALLPYTRASGYKWWGTPVSSGWTPYGPWRRTVEITSSLLNGVGTLIPVAGFAALLRKPPRSARPILGIVLYQAASVTLKAVLDSLGHVEFEQRGGVHGFGLPAAIVLTVQMALASLVPCLAVGGYLAAYKPQRFTPADLTAGPAVHSPAPLLSAAGLTAVVLLALAVACAVHCGIVGPPNVFSDILSQIVTGRSQVGPFGRHLGPFDRFTILFVEVALTAWTFGLLVLGVRLVRARWRVFQVTVTAVLANAAFSVAYFGVVLADTCGSPPARLLYRSLVAEIIYTAFSAAFTLPAVATLWLYWRWKKTAVLHGAFPYCLRCGYNLTGNVSGRCPECGAAVPTGTPPSARRLAEGRLPP